MTQKPKASKAADEDLLVKNIRRKIRQTYSAKEKIRIVLVGLRGEESIAVLCRREGIAESLYYSWSKAFLEAGKRRLSGDTARQLKDFLQRLHCLSFPPQPSALGPRAVQNHIFHPRHARSVVANRRWHSAVHPQIQPPPLGGIACGVVWRHSPNHIPPPCTQNSQMRS